MAWELLAIWLIVGSTTIWFVRDEKRRRADAAVARAARYYAHAGKYRHVSATAIAQPPLRPITSGLSREQREFFETLLRPKA